MGSEEIPFIVTASSITNLLTQLPHNSVKAKVGIGMEVNMNAEWWVLFCFTILSSSPQPKTRKLHFLKISIKGIHFLKNEPL